MPIKSYTWCLLLLLGMVTACGTKSPVSGETSSDADSDSDTDSDSDSDSDADSDSDSDSDSDTDTDTDSDSDSDADSDSDSDSDSDTDTDSDTDSNAACEYECSEHCVSVGGTVMPGTCETEGFKCCNLSADTGADGDTDTDSDTDTENPPDTDVPEDTDNSTCVGGTSCVDLKNVKQMIQGYGGINCPLWSGQDLTAAQRDTAFGNGPDQLGFTILRLFISDNKNQWNTELATAKRAQELGALLFASPWNPPAGMTTTINGQKHVDPAKYSQYAAHLLDFYNYMKDNGVDVYSVSIQNEPDYADEWTWWSATEIVNFLKNNAANFPFKVMAPESFQYRKNMSDPILNDAAALANMDILGAHLYGTQVRDFPYPLFKEKGAGKELWMTEVYVPNSSANSANNWPEALQVGTSIHNAMVEAEFQAYVWWFIRRSYGPMTEDGKISKRGYNMAHFSKFVRRGFYRVDVPKSPANGLLVSAYKSNTDVVIVVVNNNNATSSANFSVAGRNVTSFEKYTTSSSKNMSKETDVQGTNGSFNVSFDAQSITTLHASSL